MACEMVPALTQLLILTLLVTVHAGYPLSGTNMATGLHQGRCCSRVGCERRMPPMPLNGMPGHRQCWCTRAGVTVPFGGSNA